MKLSIVALIALAVLAVPVSWIAQACHKDIGHPIVSWYRYSGEVGLLDNINMDGCVDLADLDILTRWLGNHFGDPGFNPCADLNADVDLVDRAILDQPWGKRGFYIRHDPTVRFQQASLG